eukprot:CAMPEP_0185576938 /NCGR_PEP_ID=MMETSP0434-20130131/7749_1 /TAXON_ID=626734 ORGANISM="Favella taraikaensis, Strain Fe Narragansett Bay" /NCGR_SAMPLE_ID=MMETSP0434 /ASSEMBLY_ACC=CAM_ASM_000379 /LENGTH=46 /DNA_ID= /DNA_START= /DNA_END= /DNA_ORIENTATION=
MVTPNKRDSVTTSFIQNSRAKDSAEDLRRSEGLPSGTKIMSIGKTE